MVRRLHARRRVQRELLRDGLAAGRTRIHVWRRHWGDISTEIVKYYLWTHYNLRGKPTTQSLAGHVNLWAFKRTNFFGTANNH